MTDTTSPWKKITVPKMVYLPTGSPPGEPEIAFKDTGCRVEPSDVIEIDTTPGSRAIRINGVLHYLIIPIKKLRVDPETNCLILDKPAPPVATLSRGGNGRAYVGKEGIAIMMARGDTFWTKELPKEATQKEGAPLDPFFKGSSQPPPTSKFPVLDEERVTRTITLKNGSTAEVLIDPSTGRIASGPSRMYDGAGLGALPSQEMLAAQNAEAVDCTPGKEAPRPPAPAHQVQEGFPTGNEHLDGFLEAHTGTKGFPLGAVSYIHAPNTILDAIIKVSSAATCQSLEAAFAKIHSPTEVVVIHLPQEEPTPEIRLEIAELLPTLATALQSLPKKVAVLICSSWASPPAILSYIATTRLSCALSPTNDRFIFASLPPSDPSRPTHSITFPMPPQTT